MTLGPDSRVNNHRIHPGYTTRPSMSSRVLIPLNITSHSNNGTTTSQPTPASTILRDTGYQPFVATIDSDGTD